MSHQTVWISSCKSQPSKKWLSHEGIFVIFYLSTTQNFHQSKGPGPYPKNT
jgi:hypothetical protein